MARLRGPEGCPWDHAQDYDSLKAMLLEEAYEVVDTVNARDLKGLEEELGDLLFQVIFYSRLAEEEKRFRIDDVIEHVHDKLIRRHPHVFGQMCARSAEEALQSWLGVKEKERENEAAPGSAPGSVLEGVPKTLPATLEAHEIGLRASEVGFDWQRAEDLLDKLSEEITELRRELAGHDRDRRRRVEEEVGDLMFAVTNLARLIGSDAESCLRRANQKFARRFRALETEVASRGKQVRQCTLPELEEIWNALKHRELERNPGT